MTIRVVVAGATGWTGEAVARGVLSAEDVSLVGAVARKTAGQDIGSVLLGEPCGTIIHASVEDALIALDGQVDVFIDYTATSLVKGHALQSIKRGIPVIVGTSGLSAEEFVELDAAAREYNVGVISGNFSLTAALMQHLSILAAEHVPEFEVMDYAWGTKEDVPSGTARELADRLGDVRKPVLGRQVDEVIGPKETRGASVNGVQVHSVRMSGFTLRCEALFGLEGERLSISHEAGQSAQPYVYGTLIAARRIQNVVGVVRGLDQLLFSQD